jgi:hypothetical protein
MNERLERVYDLIESENIRNSTERPAAVSLPGVLHENINRSFSHYKTGVY